MRGQKLLLTHAGITEHHPNVRLAQRAVLFLDLERNISDMLRDVVGVRLTADQAVSDRLMTERLLEVEGGKIRG